MDPFKDVGPGAFGIVVIVLLQLAQFFFAWRKDSHREAAVRKEDLAAVRRELKEEIKEVEEKMESFSIAVDVKLDAMTNSAARWRGDITTKLTHIEVKNVSANSTTVATLEFIKQQVASLNTKVDKLNSKT